MVWKVQLCCPCTWGRNKQTAGRWASLGVSSLIPSRNEKGLPWGDWIPNRHTLTKSLLRASGESRTSLWVKNLPTGSLYPWPHAEQPPSSLPGPPNSLPRGRLCYCFCFNFQWLGSGGKKRPPPTVLSFLSKRLCIKMSLRNTDTYKLAGLLEAPPLKKILVFFNH